MSAAVLGPLPPLAPPTPAYPDTAPFVQPILDVETRREGYQETLRGSDPAAGASFRFRVSGAESVLPLAVMATLATSGAAGDRAVAVEWWDKDGSRFMVAGAPVTVPASQAQTFAWWAGAGSAAWPVTDAAIAPLPRLVLYPLQSLVVRLADGDAADQLSMIQLALERFPS